MIASNAKMPETPAAHFKTIPLLRTGAPHIVDVVLTAPVVVSPGVFQNNRGTANLLKTSFTEHDAPTQACIAP